MQGAILNGLNIITMEIKISKTASFLGQQHTDYMNYFELILKPL